MQFSRQHLLTMARNSLPVSIIGTNTLWFALFKFSIQEKYGKERMIVGKINNDGKVLKGGFSFLVKKLNLFH